MNEKVVVPSLNKILLAGRLTKNAEKRFTSDNTGIISFRLASSKKYKDKNGEWKENTLFINVSYFAKYTDNLEKRLLTGVPVIIEGSLDLNTYESKTTHEKVSTYQIKASKVYVLTRITDDDSEIRSTADTTQVIEDIDKDFDEIGENENTGGSDGIPF